MSSFLLSFLLALLVVASSTQSRAQDAKTNFFLPQNPVAAAYVLGRLSNQELIAAPRGEFVFVALLQRAGLERKYRTEALEGLSRLRHTDQLTELIRGLSELDKKGESVTPVVQDLGLLLLQARTADLAAMKAKLEPLTTESDLTVTRQIGYAAVITADAAIEPSWKTAEADPARLANLILAIPLIRDAALRASAYPKIKPLLDRTEPVELRRAAITAIVAVPGHDTESFNSLSGLIQAGTERATAIASLQRIPMKEWPKEGIVPLVDSLIQYLSKVSADDRTSPVFASALQLATDLASLLPPDKSLNSTKILRGLGPTVIVLHAVYEQLRYDKQLIVVQAGKPVALVLDNQDAMPHNVAVLMPGALEEIGTAAEKMPAEPDAEGRLYIPVSPKVLHASKLAAPGQKIQLSFTAPTTSGEYPYVCTFPGHWRRMTGIMVVAEDVEAYLAAHSESQQPKITEWKLEDVTPELAKISNGRNFDEGKKLFTQLACVQCHKLGKEGYPYGPELTGVMARYKNDRAAVLQQILEPSKVIEDRYRAVSFELKGGESVTGMVLKESAESVNVQSGPADSLIQVLKKSEILSRQPQSSSPMPIGLLNSLSKEQILDLLAFIESGGEAPVHQHPH